MLQVPVERLTVLGALQHDVTEALNGRGLTQWPLGLVGPRQLVAGVEREGRLGRQRREFVRVCDDANRGAARIDEVDPYAADRLR